MHLYDLDKKKIEKFKQKAYILFTISHELIEFSLSKANCLRNIFISLLIFLFLSNEELNFQYPGPLKLSFVVKEKIKHLWSKILIFSQA